MSATPATPLTLGGLMHRSTVAVPEESLAAYALLSVGPAPARVASVPLNLALVLDLSGSMYEADGTGRSRRDRLQQALRSFIGRLRPGDRLAIVAFGLDASVVLPSSRMEDGQRAAAVVERLDRWPVDPSGTALDQGLATGLAEVARHAGPDAQPWVVVLTDGETAEEPICRDLAENAARKGVGLSAVGLGAGWNPDLLADLARAGGGPCYAADERQPDALREALDEEAARLTTLAWQRAALRLRPMRDVKPKRLFRLRTAPAEVQMESAGGRAVRADLGALPAAGADFLLELSLPRRPEGRFVVAEADVVAVDEAGLDCTSQAVSLVVTYAEAGGGAEPEVADALAAAQIADIYDALTRAIRAEDRPEAERLAEWLARKAEGEPTADAAREVARQVREDGRPDRRGWLALVEAMRRRSAVNRPRRGPLNEGA